jgi:hypothetical protein
MDPIKNEPATKAAQAKNRNVAFILGGMGIFGNSSPHSVLVLFSSSPGPPHGSSDKSEAPPEDVSKARPRPTRADHGFGRAGDLTSIAWTSYSSQPSLER